VDPLEDLVGVRGVAYGGRGEAQHLLAALVLRHHEGLGDEPAQRLDTLLRHAALAVEVLGQTQRLLVRERGQRRRTAVRVDDKQVPGVRTDVQNPNAHGPHAIATRRVGTCPRLIWFSHARGSSLPIPPTTPRCSSAT
jgi:hypothetical protein